MISTIENGAGVVPKRPLRVYPAYALVLITRGHGSYQDESGLDLSIQAGDAILVFPGLAHVYGPAPGTKWDELYVIFDGPAFDSWRAAGVISPAHPIIRQQHGVDVAARITEIAETGNDRRDATGEAHREDLVRRRSLQVCSLLTLLCEICSSGPSQEQTRVPSQWVSRACALLAHTGPEGPSLDDAARALGVSTVTFRRRFLAEVGVAPGLWRAKRRMESACHLLQYSQVTFAQLAEQLGYADEYHFSKRFKQLIGVTPSVFRHRIRNNT